MFEGQTYLINHKTNIIFMNFFVKNIQIYTYINVYTYTYVFNKYQD